MRQCTCVTSSNLVESNLFIPLLTSYPLTSYLLPHATTMLHFHIPRISFISRYLLTDSVPLMRTATSLLPMIGKFYSTVLYCIVPHSSCAVYVISPYDTVLKCDGHTRTDCYEEQGAYRITCIIPSTILIHILQSLYFCVIDYLLHCFVLSNSQLNPH